MLVKSMQFYQLDLREKKNLQADEFTLKTNTKHVFPVQTQLEHAKVTSLFVHSRLTLRILSEEGSYLPSLRK